MQPLIIAQCYQVFAKYKQLSNPMRVCCEQCFSKADEKLLKSKPLRQLTAEDFSAYLDAPIIEGGDIDDFKHLLPRLLALETQGAIFHGINATIFPLFKVALYQTWDSTEVEIINRTIEAYWQDILQQKAAISIYFEVLDSSGYGSEKLLAMLAREVDSLAEFVLDIEWYSETLINHPVLQNWLRQEILIEKLEKAFFESQNTDKASKLSQAVDRLDRLKFCK